MKTINYVRLVFWILTATACAALLFMRLYEPHEPAKFEHPDGTTKGCIMQIYGHLLAEHLHGTEFSMIGSNNGVNESMELLFSAITRLPDKEESLFKCPTSDTDLDGRLEFADGYGNPLIFLRESKSFVVRDRNGKEFEVQITGIEPGKSFALWSMGYNGLNEYGLGDDVWLCWQLENGIPVMQGAYVGSVKWSPTED